MRLEHLLMKHFSLSRREMKKMIRNGEVLIDGQPATHVSNNVDASIQQIIVNGKPIVDTSHRYFMLNKPKGVVSATSDNLYPTVIDLLKEEAVEQLYPIGRLDRDTEGLLLITNNGPLGYRMLNPERKVEKEYYVEVNGLLDEHSVEAFKSGIIFHGGYQCQPSLLRILSASDSFSTATVVISEGKFHQVKKMFLSIGVKVTFLRRIRFAEFMLDESLAPGEYRSLNATELELLKKYFT